MNNCITIGTPKDGLLVGSAAYDRPYYRHSVLFLLLLVYMFNFIDRQLLVILQESIKDEMGFSDSQLGLMSGFAFALLYVSFGIPIARWADAGNRRNIIALSLGVWSFMTAICGMAQNFVQMLLARMGVAIGEAGGTPPALSMISDMYPQNRRATAMAVYSSGVYFGLMLGFVLGGLIGHHFGWRMAFILIGLPGVLLAIFLRFVVKEPLRSVPQDSQSESAATKLSFKQVLGELRQTRTFVLIALAGGLASFASYGVGNWIPSYLLREFGATTADVGVWLGLASGLGGIVGTFGGGLLVDSLIKRDIRWYVWLPGMAVFSSLIVNCMMLVSNNLGFAIVLAGGSYLLSSCWLPIALALSTGLVRANVRAQATAVLFFIINIIGLGLGPTLVGILADVINAGAGGNSLRLPMLIVAAMGTSVAALCFACSASSIKKDLKL